MRLAVTVAVLLLASSGCGGDSNDGGVVDLNDTSPPSKVAMDAFVPRRSGDVDIVTVSITSGDQAVTLDNLRDITLIAVARDEESAISKLEIHGGTTVHCVSPELGQRKDADWSKPSGGGDEPRFTREVALNIELAKQSPTDTEFIGRCPPDMKLMSITGHFAATADNGVGLRGRTGQFSFSWSRPS
jgi:hypothetical protein